MSSSPPAPEPDVRIQIRELLPDARPCIVTRHLGVTLLTIDPTATKLEVAEFSVVNLTTPEVEAIRRGYGMPPIGESAPEWLLEGTIFLYVPASLRLPGDPAIQGAHPDCEPVIMSEWLLGHLSEAG